MSGHEYDLEREFYVIHLENDLVDNVFITQYIVNMTFTAILNDKLAGFYRSSYQNEAGETEYLGITQFQVMKQDWSWRSVACWQLKHDWCRPPTRGGLSPAWMSRT